MDKTKSKSEMNRVRVRRHREVQRAMQNELRRYTEGNSSSSDDNVNEEMCLQRSTDTDSSLSTPSVGEYNRQVEGDIDFGHHGSISSEDLDNDENNGLGEVANAVELNDIAIDPENLGGTPEIEQIRKWALECDIPHAHLDKLLNILRVRLLTELPKSSKTFLKTNSMLYEIQKIQDRHGNPTGSYVYFGVECGLQKCVNPVLHRDRVIKLQINVDGLPLYVSSKVQFWPILCKVFCHTDVYKPFMVGLFCGQAKPHCVNLYLHDFVDEMSDLLTNGIEVLDVHFTVHIQCFICDTPARAFMKQTKGHGGFSACERCTVYGSRVQRRTVYPEIDEPERTDGSFRNMEDEEHHNGRTVLTRIVPPINLVTSFVLDFMHLCCVGVMKRLLIQHWISGPLRVRLSQCSKALLSKRFEALHDQIPAEFQRKTRGLQFAALWKATEFRFFLLYCGPIVLRNILPKKLYRHFLLLHVACRMLNSDKLALVHNALAKLYLRRFISILSRLYGECATVLNMHNLIHIADDAKNMGCSLSRITAFPFESFLGRLKKQIRTPNQPLAQICRRLHEQSFIMQTRAMPNDRYSIIKRDRNAIAELVNVHRLKYMGFILTSNAPNDIFLLKNNKIAKIKKMFFHEESPDDLQVEYAIWKVKRNIFNFPTPSKSLCMWELKENYSCTTSISSIHIIEQKMVKLSLPMRPQGNIKHFVIPILHH